MTFLLFYFLMMNYEISNFYCSQSKFTYHSYFSLKSFYYLMIFFFSM